MTQHPISETRVISILETARAKAKAEGKTDPTYEEKFFALLAYQAISIILAGRNPELTKALVLLTKQLAPEFTDPANKERNARFAAAFNADHDDVAAGKVDMGEFFRGMYRG